MRNPDGLNLKYGSKKNDLGQKKSVFFFWLLQLLKDSYFYEQGGRHRFLSQVGKEKAERLIDFVTLACAWRN